jgi:hypothetical protein
MLNCIKIWNNIPYLSGTWKYPDLIKEKKKLRNKNRVGIKFFWLIILGQTNNLFIMV